MKSTASSFPASKRRRVDSAISSQSDRPLSQTSEDGELFSTLSNSDLCTCFNTFGFVHEWMKSGNAWAAECEGCLMPELRRIRDDLRAVTELSKSLEASLQQLQTRLNILPRLRDDLHEDHELGNRFGRLLRTCELMIDSIGETPQLLWRQNSQLHMLIEAAKRSRPHCVAELESFINEAQPEHQIWISINHQRDELKKLAVLAGYTLVDL